MSHLTGFIDSNAAALPLYVLDRESFTRWCAQQPTGVLSWAQAQRFEAAPGSVLLLPGDNGLAGRFSVLAIVLMPTLMRMRRWHCRRPAAGRWPTR